MTEWRFEQRQDTWIVYECDVDGEPVKGPVVAVCYDKTLAHRIARLPELEAKVEQFQAVVKKLPKCWRLDESGVRVQDVPVVGMGDYFILCDRSGVRSVCVAKIDYLRVSCGWNKSIEVVVWAKSPFLQGTRMLTATDLYDTCKAAEAAGKEAG